MTKTSVETESKNTTMKPTCLLAIASMLMVALTSLAQQNSGSGGPTVQAHLKVLTEKLGLSDAQQAKARPILQEMNDAVQKIMQDDTLSHKEQLDKVRPCREKADKKLRKILNDDQKVKLDQLEHQPHPELHGFHVTGFSATLHKAADLCEMT